MLSDLSLHLGPYDRLSTSRTAPLRFGETVRLTRVRHRAVIDTRTVPFSVRRINDSKMMSGRTKIVTAGRTGLTRIAYAVIFVDGKRVGTTHIDRTVLRAPRTRSSASARSSRSPCTAGRRTPPSRSPAR